MEYIFELREGLWNGKREKIIVIFMAIVLLSTVVTMAYDRTDIRGYGRIGETTEVANSIVALSEIKAASIMEDVLLKKTENMVEDIPTTEIVTAVEIPIERMETTAVEIPTESVETTVVEIPVEKIENIVAEAPTEDMENSVVEKIESIVVETPVDEVKNTITDVPKEIIVESAFMIDEAGMIYGFRPELADLSKGYLELPTEGCTGIRRGTFSGCTEWITEIYIPSNIVNIEDGAMTELCSLEYIVAETGHPMFTTVDGVLYDIAGTTLLAYPAARVGAYFVPEQVQAVLENAFLNTSLSIIDVRGCGLSANCLLNISESCSIIE